MMGPKGTDLCYKVGSNLPVKNFYGLSHFAFEAVRAFEYGGEMHTSLCKSVLVFGVVIGMTGLGVAQRTTATFAGIVTDPTSAVLPVISI